MSRTDRPQQAASILVAAWLLITPTIAAAAVPLNHIETGVTIASPSTEVLRTIDLGTLPERAGILIEVVPDDLSVELEIELGNWSGLQSNGQCISGAVLDGSTPSALSDPAVGATSLLRTLVTCDPGTTGPFWASGRVDATVRVVDWGGSGGSVDVDLSIRGVTIAPTNELLADVDESTTPQTVSLWPFKDTVLYESDPATSNGAGQSLWIGHDFQLVGGPLIFIQRWYGLRSLLAFDIVGNIPIGSNVTHAELELYALEARNGGATTWVYETDGDGAQSWHEGTANAPGDEFVGAVSGADAANWLYRRDDEGAWTTPGGDAVGGALDAETIDSVGYVTFSSTALNDSVQGMVDSRVDEDGFLLVGPSGGVVTIEFAARFASSEYPTTSRRPELHVWYEPGGPHLEGSFWNGTESYIAEGQNFRWIYDTDDDGLLTTAIGGVCEALEPSNTTSIPYNYAYAGPSYTGTDCCAWQIESQQSGVIGTGQAIFFHNLDPGNPANLPPDSDADGMRDGCDNCVAVPNGPLLGSCMGLAGVGGTCLSDLDCGQYEFCSQSQEDFDVDGSGDACSVPEPGFGAGLALGLGALASLSRTRLNPTRRRPRD